MYKTAQDNYGCGLRHAPPVSRQRAALAGRKGHLFLSVKAWTCDPAMCLWDSICPEGASFPNLHSDAL